MSVDHILGVLVILGVYGLTWYLLLKSTKIVNNIAEQGSEHAHGTEPEPKPENGPATAKPREDGAGSDR